jgi:hypothetical protein
MDFDLKDFVSGDRMKNEVRRRNKSGVTVAGEKRIEITKRDLEILRFCLEMKFSDLESIYRKFFSANIDGSKSKSILWARERVNQLNRFGYLHSQRASFSGYAYFLTTKLGQLTLKNFYPDQDFVRPTKTIDIRFFEHDRFVLKSRVYLEAQAGVTSWRPEKCLKLECIAKSGLGREYQPDAIFTNSRGERVAFELEHIRKSKEKYQDKIQKYVDVIRRPENSHFVFEKVLFVSVSKPVMRTLKEFTEVYQDYFQVVSFDELLKIGVI